MTGAAVVVVPIMDLGPWHAMMHRKHCMGGGGVKD